MQRAAAAPRVVAVYGPTGSGKTDVAVHLARELGTEVVNCDPAQCYDGLPVLTNKPGPGHDAIAPHRMVGIWPLSRDATVVDYAGQARAEIDELVHRYGSAVVAGGSGLYMRAALTGMAFAGTTASEAGGHDVAAAASPLESQVRRALEVRWHELGAEAAHAELASIDPVAAAGIHPNDRKRVIRALEAAHAGGSVARGSLWDTPDRHPTRVFNLQPQREAIVQRIAARTRTMFEQGDIVGEVAAVVGPRAEHVGRLSHTALQIHGVRDCIAVLRGEVDREQAVTRLDIRTRQYAKRQATWARRWPGLVQVPIDVVSYEPADAATLLAANVRHGVEAG